MAHPASSVGAVIAVAQILFAHWLWMGTSQLLHNSRFPESVDPEQVEATVVPQPINAQLERLCLKPMMPQQKLGPGDAATAGIYPDFAARQEIAASLRALHKTEHR